ncbi:MAG: transrane sensor protein [Caulobacteraceae bacterium]|nr:transrane sensor protein [Caulobacteraceae bacterium]
MPKERSEELEYGPVLIIGGRNKGRILYYDDDDNKKTAICYAGHPLDFVGNVLVRKSLMRYPTVDDLLRRREAIWRTLNSHAIRDNWNVHPTYIHQLWSERTMVYSALEERRMIGSLPRMGHKSDVFLCHSSADKWLVRRVHDDLATLGASPWLDENQIKVGDSIVAKIDEALQLAPTMIVFLSEISVKSLWTSKEWQSFLARKLSGKTLQILPALVENCEIPSILQDVKYADFREEYNDGFKQIYDAIT